MPNKPPQKNSRNEIFPHFSSHNQFFTLTLQPNKNKTMKNIFKIKKEERILALVSMLVFASLNAMLIHSYPASFFKAGKLGFWSIFYKHFTVSGFDAYSYIFLSNEKIYFELSRHPLFGALSRSLSQRLADGLVSSQLCHLHHGSDARHQRHFLCRILLPHLPGAHPAMPVGCLHSHGILFLLCLHHAHHDGTRSFLLFHALSAGLHLYGGNLYGAGQTAQGMAG